MNYLHPIAGFAIMILVFVYADFVIRWSDMDYCVNWHIEEKCRAEYKPFYWAKEFIGL